MLVFQMTPTVRVPQDFHTLLVRWGECPQFILQSVSTEVEDSLPCVDPAVLQGRLKNSESLSNLQVLLGHLAESKQADLCNVIKSFPCLFSDTPTQTNLIEHDIDVGDAQPIRQRFYRVTPGKHKYLDAERKYMLDIGIAEPSSSSWASPCLLVPTSDNTPRFCTDFRKLKCSNETRLFSASSHGGLCQPSGPRQICQQVRPPKRLLAGPFV